MGAPASFPIQAENRMLQQYLQWNAFIRGKADTFIKTRLPKGPFVGVHLRNGPDWTRVCEHVDTSPKLFAAPQCLGYQNEHGRVTQELCFPTKQTILKQIKRIAKDIKAKSVFVASDHDHMIKELSHALKKLKVSNIIRWPDTEKFFKLAVVHYLLKISKETAIVCCKEIRK